VDFISWTPIKLNSLFLFICPLALASTKWQTSNCGSCSAWYYVLPVTLLSTGLHLQMFIEISHWSSLRPLASTTLSILESHLEASWISYCCFVLCRYCNFVSIGPAAPSHTPAIHRQSNVGEGQTQISRFLGGGCPGQSVSSPILLIWPGWALQHSPTMQKVRVSSSALCPLGLHHWQSLQPVLYCPGPSLLSATSCEGNSQHLPAIDCKVQWGLRAYLSSPWYYSVNQWQAQQSHAHTVRVWSPTNPPTRASSTVFPRHSVGLTLFTVVVIERQGQLSHSHYLWAGSPMPTQTVITLLGDSGRKSTCSLECCIWLGGVSALMTSKKAFPLL
jgi:hypothetical protein